MLSNKLEPSRQFAPQPQWFLDLLGVAKAPAEHEEAICHGQKLVMKDNILRAIETVSSDQEQTKGAFGFIWSQRDIYERDALNNKVIEWAEERYGDFNELDFSYLDGRKISVLDAGCGAGLTGYGYFKPYFDKIRYIGNDISEAIDMAYSRSADLPVECAFVQSDLNSLPFADQSIDVVLSDGVLHHTDNTERAFLNVARVVRKGGYIMFYVYRKKGPIREFTDDYIRKKMQNMTPQEAWEAMIPLSKLGKVLGDLNIEIDIPEAIDLLDIPAGKINLQRFVYWHVMKAFYRPEMSIDEMNHINFDWYMPKNAHRHTIEEVRNWCKNAGFDIKREKEEEAGITIIAKRT